MAEPYPASSMPDRDWWAALWPDPKATLRAMGVREGMTVLDLCCGDGLFTAPLAQLVDGQVHALDLDPVQIEAARAEVSRQGASVLRWITGDAGEVAHLLLDPVDYVLMANTFHGVPDKAGLVRAVKEVLKPGGRFGLLNWKPLAREATPFLGQPRGPRTDMRMPAETVASILKSQGLRPGPVLDVGPYHYALVAKWSCPGPQDRSG